MLAERMPLDEQRKFGVDFRALQSGLGIGEFVPSRQVFGAADEVFIAREHGYRRIDAHTLLHVLNFEAGQPYSLKLARPDLVCIQAIISGSYSRWIGPRMDLVPPQLLQISNVPISISDVEVGRKLRGLLIVCDRQHLLDHYKLNVAAIPAPYRPIFLSREGTPEVLQLPLSATGIGLVDQILGCKYAEPLRGIFLGVKTVEILCDVVAQLHRPQRTAAPRLISGRAKQKAIETAAEIYRRELGELPSIEMLALRVGLNRNELTSGFRRAFGLTPHAYAQMHRMERARDMLQAGQMSISEVARRVGYEGYASFARAYHAHFGHAPALSGGQPAATEAD